MTDDYLATQIDFSDPDIVSSYDELSLWSAMFGLLLLERVPMRRDMTVLDLGYGAGFPLLELAERLGERCQVYGVDPWDAARQRTADKAAIWQVRNVKPLPGSAAELDFPDGMFDLIVSNLGINNFADPQAAFHACYRVAKPGARMAITTNLQGHMAEFYQVFEATLREMGRAALLPTLQAHIAHRATLPGVRALFETAGFHVTTVHEQAAVLRYLDGSALLRHHFIRWGFLDAWKEILEPGERAAFFACLEKNLNQLAGEQGELRLTIPMAYVEAQK